MKNIAVLGTGIMGSGIALNFLKKGYKVFVWNRTKEKLQPLIKRGAVFSATPKMAAENADIIFEVTASDESSRLVWLGENGILSGARRNAYFIASGTFSVDWIEELGKICEEKKLTFFDIPLTGSRSGAEGGALVLLAGGNLEKLNEIKPDLSAISQQVLYFGKLGSGMKYKLILNLLQAIHMIGFKEVMKISESAGLDPIAVGNALSERPGGTATNIAWKGYQQIPDQTNFSVQWITKDLRYAQKLADKIHLPLSNDVLSVFERGLEKGMGEKDWTSIMKV